MLAESLLSSQALCHVLYNPRLMSGCGLTYGDNPEHFWAAARRHNGSGAYMSDALRQDMYDLVVRLHFLWEYCRKGLLRAGSLQVFEGAQVALVRLVQFFLLHWLCTGPFTGGQRAAQ